MPETYYDESGNLVFDSIDGSTYLLPDDEDEALALLNREAEAENFEAGRQQYLDALDASTRQTERVLGRPVTEAEFSQALDHLKPGPQPDFAAAYEEAFPQDRTRDDDARQDLMAEFMEDDTAQKEAEEAGAVENAVE